MLFRLRNKLPPPLEAENFLAPPKAGEIETAIFASPFPRSQQHFYGHPKRRVRVGFTRPRIQVHAPANRAPGVKKIAPHECARGEALLAMQTSQRRYQAERSKQLRPVAHSRRLQKAASTLWAGDHCRAIMVRRSPVFFCAPRCPDPQTPGKCVTGVRKRRCRRPMPGRQFPLRAECRAWWM